MSKDGNPRDNRSIGVFDSGVGGLTILKELQRLLPKENFVYLADQLYLPYGEKSKKELVRRVYKITDYFLRRHNVKMMVAACNTVTANTIDELRKKYTIPIVGTVPAVKVAAERTKTGTVAVISTVQTSKSEALKKLIKEHCQDIKVLNISSNGLVERVDEGELSSDEINTLLRKYLSPVARSDADYLVLGCTHYPFLKRAIKKVVGRPIGLVDGNTAIANQTKKLLENNSLENRSKKDGKILFFSTGDAKQFSKVAGQLSGKKVVARNVEL